MDFQNDVIEASREVPVLVDFWAPWCGPCKMLGPVLEKVAGEAGGRWKLVKVNTEENHQIASEYNISSIPNVKLFHDGKEIDEFLGFKSEAELKRWIDYVLPSPHERSVMEARELLDAGNTEAAADRLRPVVDAEPDNERARVFLAEASWVDRPSEAETLLQSVHEDSDFFNQAVAIRELIELCRQSMEELPPGKGREGYLSARRALQRRDYDLVMQGVIQSFGAERGYANQAAPRLGKALIKLLGIRHPVIDEHYSQFSSLLNA